MLFIPQCLGRLLFDNPSNFAGVEGRLQAYHSSSSGGALTSMKET